MTQNELALVLEKHKLWLNGEDGGECANLQYADLEGADLEGANLEGANLDYSCLPLWCGSLLAHFDDRQVVQFLYHTLAAVQNSKNVSEGLKEVLLTNTNVEIANRFHRVDECGKIKINERG